MASHARSPGYRQVKSRRGEFGLERTDGCAAESFESGMILEEEKEDEGEKEKTNLPTSLDQALAPTYNSNVTAKALTSANVQVLAVETRVDRMRRSSTHVRPCQSLIGTRILHL